MNSCVKYDGSLITKKIKRDEKARAKYLLISKETEEFIIESLNSIFKEPSKVDGVIGSFYGLSIIHSRDLKFGEFKILYEFED